MEREDHLTVVFIPDGPRETRSVRVSVGRLRWAMLGGAGLLAVLCVILGSWWYLMGRARHAQLLEEQLAVLVAREAQVAELVRTLEEVEAGYEAIRSLFGNGTADVAGELWLPPPTGARGGWGAAGTLAAAENLPASWPLTERGFVTQILMESTGTEHPGVDIAIPAGSYVRAAGSGMVIEAGDDPVYGNYVIIDHGEGWESLYAHASLLFVVAGDAVRRSEVIALSGSSGRSTAPHLHFEVLRDGAPVDPLEYVAQP